MRQQIELSNLVEAIERAIVRSYDVDLAQYRVMKRFGWSAVGLAVLTFALEIAGIATYSGLFGVLTAFAAIGWFTSRAEWQATHRLIAVLELELAQRQVYVGGRDYDVYLTTDPDDNAWRDAIGKWLRSPLPDK